MIDNNVMDREKKNRQQATKPKELSVAQQQRFPKEKMKEEATATQYTQQQDPVTHHTHEYVRFSKLQIKWRH